MKYLVKPVQLNLKKTCGGKVDCNIYGGDRCGLKFCVSKFPDSEEKSKQEAACQSFCWGKICRPVHSMPF